MLNTEEASRGPPRFPAPLHLSPFSPSDRDRWVDSPALSARVPYLPGESQDKAGLLRKFETEYRLYLIKTAVLYHFLLQKGLGNPFIVKGVLLDIMNGNAACFPALEGTSARKA